MQHYVFLDMDGVLLHYQHQFDAIRDGGGWIGSRDIDQSRADILFPFLNRHNIKVILSSTWRKSPDIDFDVEKFKDIVLSKTGYAIDVESCTLNLNTIRGFEIKEYIDRHQIKSYVILDDSTDMLEDQLDRFVHVSHITGLVTADIERMSTILGIDCNEFQLDEDLHL